MSRRWLLIAIVLLNNSAAAARPQPATTEIGSWILTCASSCQMRHRSWIVPPISSSPSVSLEVVRQGVSLVPAVALRGLSTQAALAALLTVHANLWLRFDDKPRRQLVCGLDDRAVVCAPQPSDAATIAQELATSRKVAIDVQLSLPGVRSLPEQSRSLNLQRTAECLARFSAAEPAPAVAGLGWRDIFGRLQQNLSGWEKPHE